MPARIVGLYALALMDRDGSVHGYGISQQIAERTEGAWRPGAGAVYPALRALVQRGLAKNVRHGRRQEYRITVRGRALLRRIRRDRGSRRTAPDLTVLWADIAGIGDPGELLLRRLERTVVAISGLLDRPSLPEERSRRLRRRTEGVLRDLERGLNAGRRSPRRGRDAVRTTA